MTWLTVAGRLVNPAAIESIHFDCAGDSAAVWLIGRSEPLWANRAERRSIIDHLQAGL